MKGQIQKYIDENILFEKFSDKKLDQIKTDITDIFNKFTNIDKDSDNSCVVIPKQEDINLRVGVFFKERDGDDDSLKFKFQDWWLITRDDVEFTAIP